MKKDHLPSNKFPRHSRIKKGAKKVSTAITRSRLKRETQNEIKGCPDCLRPIDDCDCSDFDVSPDMGAQ